MTRARRVLFSFAVFALACLDRAHAEEAPPALAHDVGAYAIYGRDAVALNGASAMPEHGSTGSETTVELSQRTLADGKDSFVAAPTVVARDASILHAVFASALELSPDVTLLHPPAMLEAPLVRAVDQPHAPVIACGGASIVVDSTSSPLALAPGRYDTVTVQQGQTLQLSPAGRYEICSLKVKAGATVEARTGTLVLLRDFLVVDGGARIAGPGACGARWVAGAAHVSPAPGSSGIEFTSRIGAGNRSLIQGQFFTPDRIWLGQNADYVGRFWAGRVEGNGSADPARTIADCREPVCGDGNVDPGEECDDGNNLDGDCCSSFCAKLATGVTCDDGRFCTEHDVCDADGRCIGTGDPCYAPDGDGNCAESCNEQSDACDGPDPDGSACDDGVYCNGADRCVAGQCLWHAGTPCSALDGDANCHEGCNEATHLCDALDTAGTPCSDGLFCTIGETCDGDGACTGGTSPCAGADSDADCAESCDEITHTCTAFDPLDSPCDDGLFCTANDRCDGHGNCRSWGDPCPHADGNVDGTCSQSCDESTRSCSAPDPDGTPCSDGLACTLGDRCIGGTCAAGTVTSCDDANPCTDEFCAPDGSCLRSFNSDACDDGNPCTTGDRCVHGVCSGTGTVDCSDDDLCSSDICDPADGTCHHTYAPAETCHVSGTSRTTIEVGYSSDGSEPVGRMASSWRAARGSEPTPREELGELEAAGRFALCIYDESAGLPELAFRLDFDPTTLDGATWHRKGDALELLYKMRAPSGTSQGVSSVRVGVDRNGAARLRLMAGANSGCSAECRSKFLPPAQRSDGRWFAMEPGMTVQWTSSTGACWSSRYERAAANAGGEFQARAR